MLASMYDASLDQFYPHSWSKPAIWPTYYNNRSWNGNQNFSMVESSQKYIMIYEDINILIKDMMNCFLM